MKKLQKRFQSRQKCLPKKTIFQIGAKISSTQVWNTMQQILEQISNYSVEN